MNETAHENSDTVGQIINYIMKNEGIVWWNWSCEPLCWCLMSICIFVHIQKCGMFVCFHLIAFLYVYSLRLPAGGNNSKQSGDIFFIIWK